MMHVKAGVEFKRGWRLFYTGMNVFGVPVVFWLCRELFILEAVLNTYIDVTNFSITHFIGHHQDIFNIMGLHLIHDLLGCC